MSLVRTLHIRKYSPAKKRFSSDVFSIHGDGISVFDYECAKATSKGICSHIEHFYNTIVGNPVVYWLIKEDNLIDFYQKNYQIGITLHKCPSSTGDTCHIDIMGIPKNKTEKYVKDACKPPNIFVCGTDDGTEIDELYAILDRLYEIANS